MKGNHYHFSGSVLRAIWLVLLLVISVLSSSQESIDGVISAVASIRNLTPLSRITYEILDRNALHSYLEGEMDREFSSVGLQRYEDTLKAFGFINETSNLKQEMMKLLSSQVAGVYDPYSKKLYLAKNFSSDDEGELLESLGFSIQDILLSHEIAHAITDQHFHLLNLPIEDHNNEDRSLAAKAVVEGDATNVMFKYITRSIGGTIDLDSTLMPLLTDPEFLSLSEGQSLEGAPRFISESLIFTYINGMALVKYAEKRGGTEEINNLYRHPPSSTEQVLHPEKYFIHENPVEVNISVPKGILSKGWKEIQRGTWGELNIRIFLENNKYADVKSASDGWAGDKYIAFKNNDGKVGFYWMITWDSTKDAEEFSNALKTIKGIQYKIIGRTVALAKTIPVNLSSGSGSSLPK